MPAAGLRPPEACAGLGSGSADVAGSPAATASSPVGGVVVEGVAVGVEVDALALGVGTSDDAEADGTSTGADVARVVGAGESFFLTFFGFLGGVDPLEPPPGDAVGVATGAGTDGNVFDEDLWNTKATAPPFGTRKELTPRLA